MRTWPAYLYWKSYAIPQFSKPAYVRRIIRIEIRY
jgi:hypothetical protein